MTRLEPWSLLTQLQKELERNLDRSGQLADTAATAEWIPAVDIKEESDRYIVWADLPGVAPECIDITMENGVLTLKGERKTDAHIKRDGLKRIERVTGAFYRRFALPDTADADGISARCTHGTLEISIPKKAAIQPRKIRVVAEAEPVVTHQAA